MLLTDKNFEDNGYVYFAEAMDTCIYKKDDLRLLVKRTGIDGYYNLDGSYVTSIHDSFKKNYVHGGLQLDLFENNFEDDLETMINFYAW